MFAAWGSDLRARTAVKDVVRTPVVRLAVVSAGAVNAR